MEYAVPPEKKALLDQIVSALRGVPNLEAIALGGSHARGTHRPDSDLDIGLYYREASPFAIDDIRLIAKTLSASGNPTVTGFCEWGPFVNGGVWIDNRSCKIDFLYRNLEQLERTIADSEAGRWDHHFDQQPPFGFRSVTTLGEILHCQPLYDPEDVLAGLKSRVATFPPALKSHIVQSTLWAAEFSFLFAEGFARDGDVPNTVACMTRIFHYLVHALFALNECYLVNDKRVAQVIAGFAHCPPDFYARASAILGQAGTTTEALNGSLQVLKSLWQDVVELAQGSYRTRVMPPSGPGNSEQF